MKRISAVLFSLPVVFAFAVPSYADLIVRGTDSLGYQLIYDTDFDITWYDFSNAPAPSWYGQVIWADALTVDFGGTIYDDWRLPTALNQDGTGPCLGSNCTGSEMGHLYYTELGNAAGDPVSPSFTDGLTGLPESFLNLQLGPYWSGTKEAPDPFFNVDNAWVFGFYGGYMGTIDTFYDFYALAVRPGDVSVPEPGTMLLLGMGLAETVLVGKRLGWTRR